LLFACYNRFRLGELDFPAFENRGVGAGRRGNADDRVTNGSTAQENKMPPQPFARGVANELSTSLLLLNVRIVEAAF
jgi:hypothetical protein